MATDLQWSQPCCRAWWSSTAYSRQDCESLRVSPCSRHAHRSPGSMADGDRLGPTSLLGCIHHSNYHPQDQVRLHTYLAHQQTVFWTFAVLGAAGVLEVPAWIEEAGDQDQP